MNEIAFILGSGVIAATLTHLYGAAAGLAFAGGMIWMALFLFTNR